MMMAGMRSSYPMNGGENSRMKRLLDERKFSSNMHKGRSGIGRGVRSHLWAVKSRTLLEANDLGSNYPRAEDFGRELQYILGWEGKK